MTSPVVLTFYYTYLHIAIAFVTVEGLYIYIFTLNIYLHTPREDYSLTKYMRHCEMSDPLNFTLE